MGLRVRSKVFDDTVDDLQSNINPFADDCALFRRIEFQEDSRTLQNGFYLL